MRLSVVVPMFNEQQAIGPCLGALLPELTAIYEVIVVDNNSSDGSADVVKALCEQHPAIRLVHESTQGLVAARDRGFRSATGDLLARIDADTQVRPGWASAIVEVFEQHGDHVAGTGLCPLYDAPFQDRYRRAHKEMTAFMRSNQSDLRIPGADARISGRRYLSGPVSHVCYNLCDQRTYRLHGLTQERRRAVVRMLVVSLPFYFAMYLPFRAYDPELQRFTVRAFFRRDRLHTRANS